VVTKATRQALTEVRDILAREGWGEGMSIAERVKDLPSESQREIRDWAAKEPELAEGLMTTRAVATRTLFYAVPKPPPPPFCNDDLRHMGFQLDWASVTVFSPDREPTA